MHKIVWYRQTLDESFKKMKHRSDFDFYSELEAEVGLDKLYRHCKHSLGMEIETATPSMFVAFSPAHNLRPYNIRHIYLIEG